MDKKEAKNRLLKKVHQTRRAAQESLWRARRTFAVAVWDQLLLRLKSP